MRSSLLLIGAAVLLPVARADACPCGPVGPACAELWTVAAVFRGRVDSIERTAATAEHPDGGKLVTFSILEPLKGVEAQARIEIHTAINRRSCGYPFVAGREYVVYASRSRAGRLTTGTCSRTRSVDRAADDLAYMRGVAAGTVLGRISGRVVLRTRDLARARDLESPMREVSVILSRGEFSISTRTDRAGVFSVSGLEPGIYQPLLQLPDRYRVVEAPSPVELADLRGCTELKAVVQPDGRANGRVLDASGSPIPGLTLELTVRDARGQVSPTADRVRTVTRRDGTYVFSGVPPGEFVIGINTQHRDSDDLAQAFHPGALSAREATPIRMPRGGEIDAGDFVVPSSIVFVQIAGMVVDSAGVPAERARVYVRGPVAGDVIQGEPVMTDFMGRFTIAALDGREYHVFAERPRPGTVRSRVDISESVPVVASAAAPFVKLILRRP